MLRVNQPTLLADDAQWLRDDTGLAADHRPSRDDDMEPEADDENSDDERVNNHSLRAPASTVVNRTVTSSSKLLTLRRGKTLDGSRLFADSCSSFISSVSQRRSSHAAHGDVWLDLPQNHTTGSRAKEPAAATPRMYRAPGSARDVTAEPPYIRSFNNSRIIRDYKPNDEYLEQMRKAKSRPSTTGAIRVKPRKKSIFRYERDLSDDEFEQVQRISRPTISSSCRESTVRIPKPDIFDLARRKERSNSTLKRGSSPFPSLNSSQQPEQRFSGQRKVNSGKVKDIVTRLYRFDPDKIPDSRRITPLHAREQPNIVNSHLWMGTDYSFRIHNNHQYTSGPFYGFNQSWAKLSF